MKTIYQLLDTATNHLPTPSSLEELGSRVADHLASSLADSSSEREPNKLWATDVGNSCSRQLWYKLHLPHEGENLQGHTLFKFLYGDLIEELVVFMLREAGHEVKDEQRRVKLELASGWVVSGKQDLVLDGTMCDVKSTSSYGFKRYKDGLTEENDSFGYLWQLSYYAHFTPSVLKQKDTGILLFVDKQNGHIAPVEVPLYTEEEVYGRIVQHIDAIDNPAPPPRLTNATKPYGKSGNECLDTKCSYCPFKSICWPGLQGYAYSHGPVWFTNVTNVPKVPKLEE